MGIRSLEGGVWGRLDLGKIHVERESWKIWGGGAESLDPAGSQSRRKGWARAEPGAALFPNATRGEKDGEMPGSSQVWWPDSFYAFMFHVQMVTLDMTSVFSLFLSAGVGGGAWVEGQGEGRRRERKSLVFPPWFGFLPTGQGNSVLVSGIATPTSCAEPTGPCSG